MYGRLVRRGRLLVAVVVGGVGAGTLLLHALYAVSGIEPVAFLVGSLAPVLVGAFLLAAAGLFVTRYEAAECVRVTVWAALGVVIIGGVGLLVVLFERANGGGVAAPLIVVGDHVTVGAGAGTLVAIYDVRVRRTTDTLRQRERALAERTDRLERLDRVNTVIRDIDAALVSATSREEIETAVCERLVALDAFPAAWVGRQQRHGDRIEHHTGVGVADFDDHPEDAPDRDAAVEAVRTRAASHATGAVVAGRAALAVPLAYEEAVYGVLVVYAADEDLFDEETRTVLSELGATIGLAINALDRRDALVGDTVVELEFRVADGDSVASRLAAGVGDPVAVRALVPRDDGTYSAIYEASTAFPDDVLDEADGSADVVEGRQIDETTLHYRVTGTTPATKAADLGGTPRDVSADPGGERLVVELPGESDVRGFVEAFTAAYPDAELLARRRRSRTDGSAATRAVERLTPRQREVLQTAYHSGYFEWPRETTGEELADLLGLSAPTVHQHLRASHRKLLEEVVASPESPPDLKD
ncbi:MAG: bacterio-opsin activator domain-containing protein [Halobacteriaceae archaeon]